MGRSPKDMLNADSRFRENWNLLIAVLTLLAMVEIPLRLALGYDSNRETLVLIFESLLTLCFGADLVLNLITGRPGRDNQTTGKSAVALRYSRPQLLLDVLAAFPFFLFFQAAGYGGFRLLKAARLIQLNRILKMPHLTGEFHHWLVRRRLSPGVFRLGSFLIGISFFAHWVACGWIVLSGNRSYVDAIYWTATTLTTVGYGDIVPISGPQKIYAIMVMIAGAGSYGYIIGNLASLLANLDLIRAGQMKKMDQVDAFLKHHSTPIDLHHRVREYYAHLFGSHSTASQSTIFDELPVPLRTEIALHMHRNILEKVPLFQNAGEDFLRAIVLKLKPVVYPPGARIVGYGEPGDAMYFIDSGTVEILNRDEAVRGTLSDGDYFGEIALVLDTPRGATVRCRGFCEFYVLSRRDFDEVLALFPDFAKQVSGTVRQRLERDQESESDDHGG